MWCICYVHVVLLIEFSFYHVHNACSLLRRIPEPVMVENVWQGAHCWNKPCPLVCRLFSRSLDDCDIIDEDVDSGDVASCLDAAGREDIVDL